MYNARRCRSKSGATTVLCLAAIDRAAPYTVPMKAVLHAVWRAGTSPSSTLGLGPRWRMDGSARLFLCARCFVQVRLCGRCDRGQRYCTPSCSSTARRIAQREAARRYQRGRNGRMVHAARSRRWRIRRHRIKLLAEPTPVTPPSAAANIVTHQGSPDGPGDAPLVAWTNDHAEAIVTSNPDQGATTPVEHAGGPTCRRCAAPLAPWVRQGLLRRSTLAWAARHDHSP